MALSLESKSFLIAGMTDVTTGNELIAAIQNHSVLSAKAMTRLKDCMSEDQVALNLQACIVGSHCLSLREQQFLKDGFELPNSAMQSVLDNLAGGYVAGPPLFNTSITNVSMPTGFSFNVLYVGPAKQMTQALTLPAGSTFASSGAGKYFKLFTGANANKYHVWFNVSGGSNTDPAPVGFTGIEVTVLTGDSAAQVATKVNTALNAHFSAPGGFGILAASAITNTGSSVITGDVGISPNTSSSVTGFPPGTLTGTLHAADSVAAAAQAAALAQYTAMSTHSSTVIPSALDGQTLTAGYYSFASGAATLAASATGTLTFSGSATDVFVVHTASTLTTGAGGAPVIALTGGALAKNVYFIVGSSATINSGTAGTFNGNIIAQVSITDTMGGTVNGSLIALTGAVTLSAASTINAPVGAPLGPVMLGAKSYLAGSTVTLVLDQTFSC